MRQLASLLQERSPFKKRENEKKVQEGIVSCAGFMLVYTS